MDVAPCSVGHLGIRLGGGGGVPWNEVSAYKECWFSEGSVGYRCWFAVSLSAACSSPTHF